MLKVFFYDNNIVQEEKLASYYITKIRDVKKIVLQFGEKIISEQYLAYLEFPSFDKLTIILINDDTLEETIIYESSNIINLEKITYNLLEENNLLVELTYIE